MWDAGIKDDKFAVIAKMNEKCKIAVKTPVGVSERFEIDKIEMQGTKFSNIKCSIQMDTLGKDCYSSGEDLFLYKKAVYIPPLGMIDDIITFALSGTNAIKTNAIVNSKIESKKLEFGGNKCYNIHIGKLKDTHSKLKVHSDTLNVKEYETYLGDIICRTGSNDNNIEQRRNQGIAAINQITSMLNLVSLGHFYFEIYEVQKYSPSDGDWVHQIKKDMDEIKLNLKEEEIRSMSHSQFKKLVKQKITKLAISNLEAKKKQKTMKIEITSFKPQEYILSKNLSTTEVQNLFKIRNNMIDVKENFKSNQENILCKLCLSFCENQQHLLQCTKIKEKLNGVMNFESLDIEMAYQSIERQEKIAKIYTIILNARKDILSQNIGNQ